MESPFKIHRDMVLAHYGTAAWMRQLVLAMWNGSDYQVGLSKLASIDDEHAKAAFEMLLSFRRRGEADKEFMDLAQKCRERLEQEEAAAKRAEELDWWMRQAESTARSLGLRRDITEDHYTWFEGRFNAGIGPGEAAHAASAANLQ